MSGLRVAVVAGGPSPEAAVSRASAQAVVAALAVFGHQPTLHELDAGLAGRLAEGACDVVFPVTHGALGEDGCLQGLLEVLRLPYVGSPVRASAIAADKPTSKVHFRAAGLPVAKDVVVDSRRDLPGQAATLRQFLGSALVVKPAGGGSAIGVTRIAAHQPDAAVIAALEAALAVDTAVLVEEFVVGRELTCGVLDVEDEGPRALPPTEIASRAADFYDFTSKYAAGGSAHRCPAPLPESVTQTVGDIAVAAFRSVGARDLGRADLILGESGHLVLLELNTLPGMTATSLYPEAAAVAGIGFPELCDRLVQRAFARPRRVVPEVVPMPA
ncbi:MAG: D-alanine--D-alanine ligase [Polyangiaceae bacterium]|nr:D-alanine--D-alanine ligase [Polyangiaceae bacterium]